MNGDLAIDAKRLLARLRELGEVGRSPDGMLSRTALSDADQAGRDVVVGWMREAGLRVEIDAVGNIFGTWAGPSGLAGPSGAAGNEPVMVGSHLDTVVDAGIFDGSYGVLAALEVVQTLQQAGALPCRPITVAAFTNEEGVRFTPDMLGSLVFAGGFAVDEALACVASDGAIFGEELERIGYAGPLRPGEIRPYAFLELHVEQGPVLEAGGFDIGVVDSLQGISWQRIVLEGQANHAGTTPLHMRRDAGLAAARITTFLHDLAAASDGTTVATVGEMRFEPGVINVIPARAELTVDLRDADEARLRQAEAELQAFLERLRGESGIGANVRRLSRFEPVRFDDGIAGLLDRVAEERGLRARRMTSGAGHDAQMLARIAPSAMIFVPSEGGVSHSPQERTSERYLEAGANVMLDAVVHLAGLARS